MRPDLCAQDNPINPRKYLGSFYTDSLVHDPLALKLLTDVIGKVSWVYHLDGLQREECRISNQLLGISPKKRGGGGMEEKATEERTGTVKFGIRLVCTGDATKIILHQRVCISREPLYMPGKSQIIHVARNSPDQLLFLVSSLYSFKMTHYDARKRTNSFEIKLT